MTSAELRRRIADRSARVAVVGCGYVGLPLAMAYADAGYQVIGIEIDPAKVASLTRGESYILDVPSATISGHVRAGRFEASADFGVVHAADVIFVSVPTPFDRAKQPDLTFVIAAAEGIAPHLRSGHLVILESTTFPGTTNEVLQPILERSGLRAGSDMYIAFSPERIDPGNRTYRIHNTPKVVGGVDPESAAVAGFALEQVVKEGGVHVVSSARAAELTKLLENTFRAVNIALVNEMAMLCDRMGIDLWEVIGAAATKPFGFMPFYPSPGVGGHCIPVDPYYLSWKAREFDFHTKFIDLAAETNLGMPFFAVARIRRTLNRADKPMYGARILVLGAAFKKDIDDARNSAAVRVMEILRSEGAVVEYHDPYVPEVALSSSLYGRSSETVRLSSVPLDAQHLSAADCVAILVGHSRVDYRAVLDGAKVVFDGVNVTRGSSGPALVERL